MMPHLELDSTLALLSRTVFMLASRGTYIILVTLFFSLLYAHCCRFEVSHVSPEDADLPDTIIEENSSDEDEVKVEDGEGEDKMAKKASTTAVRKNFMHQGWRDHQSSLSDLKLDLNQIWQDLQLNCGQICQNRTQIRS